VVLEGLKAEVRQRAVIVGRLTAREWEAELKRTTPVDTGNMRTKTTVTDRPGVIEAKVDTDYAQYVSGGTRPHKITARNKSALRFTWKGQTVIVRSVNHPGTQANPWFTDSVKRLPDTMQRIWAGLR
jgi:hypothetical protein